MPILESIPAENRPKESHTDSTLVESLRSHRVCYFFTNRIWKKILLIVFIHSLSLHSWSLHIEERRNKHLEDRIGKQRNLANSIFIDWSVKAATLASVLVYVPVGSHVSLNDTTGWRRISDKLKLPVPGENSGFAAGLHAKTMRISLDVTFSADAFFFGFSEKMWITWASTSQDERKINEIRNLQIF